MSGIDPTLLIVATLAGISAVLITMGLASSGSGAAIGDRIQRYGGRPAGTQDGSDAPALALRDFMSIDALSGLNTAVEQRDFGANLARDLARADLRLRVSEYLLLWAVSIAAVPAAFLAASFVVPGLSSPVILLVGALIGFWLPRLILTRRRNGRLSEFNAQLPEAITLISNSLRAGSSFLQSLELLTREATPPISTEFGRVIREVTLGLSFEVALDNMVRRVRSDDLELMATAVSIQHQVGGNLAEILDTISYTIRERVRIKGEIRTLTAQQRLSGYVVGAMPLALGAFLFVAAPNFMKPMFVSPPALLGLPAGIVILGLCGVMMSIGFMLIRRIVDIEV